MELVCPAGNLPALQAAAEYGADAIYIGFKDDTNARHFAGLNFTEKKVQKALDVIKGKGIKLYVAINTYPQSASWPRWQQAVDLAASLEVNAVIMADMGLLDYAHNNHPSLPLHLSVQGSATNAAALQFYKDHFDIRRAVLPRVLSMKQVSQVASQSTVDLEVFGFGSLCIMAEGRCHLSSYVTGESPNMSGVCSPAKAVQWQPQQGGGMQTRLNEVLIDQFSADENAGYPTLCKGRFMANDKLSHVLEEPTSLNTLDLLPQLKKAGIKAIKLEGRQRSPAYVEQIVRVWRSAIDALDRDTTFKPKDQWHISLSGLSEGKQTTLGAYDRPWQ